jgi:hypothetical protein
VTVRSLTCWALALLIAACGSEGPNDTETGADAAAVEQVVVGFFDAMGDMDLETAEASVTADFEMMQDTVVFDWNALLEYARPFQDGGATISYELLDFNT